MAERTSTTAAKHPTTSNDEKVGPDDTKTGSPATDDKANQPTSAKDKDAADPNTANPTVNETDRLGPGATTSGNVGIPNGTGYHCGICGRVCGKEGEHYNEDDEQTEVPHANVMVVADNWAELQDDQDREAAKKHAEKREERKTRSDKL